MRSSPTPEILSHTADALADGKVVGWYQGRMEFGPRALGNRSILTDPRRAEMKDILNARIKHREPFRPFAPVVLEEATGDYFTKDHPSPFMLMTYPVRPDKVDEIPAPTHVDGTGRLQTVRRGPEPSVLRADRRLPRTDRRSGPAEHLVQRERADLLHPRGGRRNVPAHEDGRARPRRPLRREGLTPRTIRAAEEARWTGPVHGTLVTGGTSFIGSHLVEALLDRGASVRVVDNLSSGRAEYLRDLDVELVEGDLLDQGLARRAVGSGSTWSSTSRPITGPGLRRPTPGRVRDEPGPRRQPVPREPGRGRREGRVRLLRLRVPQLPEPGPRRDPTSPAREQGGRQSPRR